jgi:hypothetical protein
MPGQVIGRGVIPVWVLLIALVLCLSVFFASSLIYRRGAQSDSVTQTSTAETAVAAVVIQTTTANQTAAAIAGQQDSDGDGLWERPG